MASVALAWLMAQPGVTSILVGARKPQEVGWNLPALDLALGRELFERCEGDARMRAGVAAVAVGGGRGLGKLRLARLLHHAVERLQRPNRAPNADRVADADGARLGLAGGDGLGQGFGVRMLGLGEAQGCIVT